MRYVSLILIIISTSLFAQEEVCWNEGLCEAELVHLNNMSQKNYLGWQITLKECEKLTKRLISSLAEPISDEMGFTKVTMIYEDKCQIIKKDFSLNSLK